MQIFPQYGHGIEPNFQVMLQYINNVMFGGLFWHWVYCICHLTRRNSHRNNRFFLLELFPLTVQTLTNRVAFLVCWTSTHKEGNIGVACEIISAEPAYVTCVFVPSNFLQNQRQVAYNVMLQENTREFGQDFPFKLWIRGVESLRSCIHHLQCNPFRILSWDKEVRRPCFCLLPREEGFISLQSNRAVCQYYLDECTYTIMIHVMQFIKI